jgi:hypothetical protein
VTSSPRDRARAFCDQYGLGLPILLAPMAGACPVGLSIEVANAGGMGALGALVMTPSGIADWVREFAAHSNGPLSRMSVDPVMALVIAVAALLAAGTLLPSPPSSRSGRVSPKPVATADRWDLPLRMLSAAVLVFALTSAAERLGSSLSGILTPFPVATAILAGFTHAQRGSAACVEFLRAYVPGLCGFAIVCVVLAIALPRLSIAWSFSAALATQLVLPTWWFSAGSSRPRR